MEINSLKSVLVVLKTLKSALESCFSMRSHFTLIEMPIEGKSSVLLSNKASEVLS